MHPLFFTFKCTKGASKLDAPFAYYIENIPLKICIPSLFLIRRIENINMTYHILIGSVYHCRTKVKVIVLALALHIFFRTICKAVDIYKLYRI